MKTTPCILALAIAAVPYGAFAHEAPGLASVSPATFVITETRTTPGLPDKDASGIVIKGADLVYENEFTVDTPAKTTDTYEYGSKAIAAKISNKEILTALLEAGAIPSESIIGWSIVIANNQEEAPKFAITDGTQYILLDEYMEIEASESTPSAETSSQKQVTTTVQGDPDIVTTVETQSNSGKSFIALDFHFNETEVNMSAIASWSNMLKLFGKGAESFTHLIDGPIKISSISGYAYDSESDEYTVIEGAISTAAAKLVNLDSL